MRSYILPKNELVRVKRIKVPDLRNVFKRDQEMQDFVGLHKNIFEAMEGVN